jgi:hypothetical protein
MPRRARVRLDWVPVHMVPRGHNRGACFFDDQERHADRNLSRVALADAPLADPRMAPDQDQPLGNDPFYAEIEAVTGHWREPRGRGRPKKEPPEKRLGDKR